MKKVERLEWVTANCGAEFVLPYFVCRTWLEIEAAINHFENVGIQWSLRTDYANSITQGTLLPFAYLANKNQAKEIWQVNRDRLIYILYDSVLAVYHNGVAKLTDPEHIIVEFNDKEPNIAQRDMYRNPENLSIAAIGPSMRYYWIESRDKASLPPIDCHNPESTWAYDRRFNIIYDLMVSLQIEELTFSVRRPDKKLIIW